MTAIAALLKATPDEIDTNCVVSGWVRTKRDSKAGFSFLAINDGSSFDSIQVVADQSLQTINLRSSVYRQVARLRSVVVSSLQRARGNPWKFKRARSRF